MKQIVSAYCRSLKANVIQVLVLYAFNTLENTMPKIKSKSGAAKRFKKTANGFKRRQAHRSHILTKKSTKRKRHLRGMEQVTAADKALIERMLPNL